MLTPADEAHHIDKWPFTVPFVCGATNLGEALRRICEGAAMIRSKGEAGTGNIVEAVRHLRSILGSIRADHAGRRGRAVRLGQGARRTDRPGAGDPRHRAGSRCRCSAPGGIATPADAALVMQLGAEAVFVGSGIFKSSDPARMASAIVEATAHFDDAEHVAKVSRGLGEAMRGLDAVAVRRAPGRPGVVAEPDAALR